MTTHDQRDSHHSGTGEPDTYPFPDHGWVCFHCGEEFSVPRQKCHQRALEAAREHFGATPQDEPLCKVATLPHAELVRRVRAAEESERAAIEARQQADDEAEAAHSALSSLGTYFKGARTVYDAFCLFDSMEGRALAAEERAAALGALISAPVVNDFLQGVRIEAAHQQERWGVQHDEGKSPEEWLWLVAYLCTKATQAARYGDREKHRHHVITAAAALLNWHRHATGEAPAMRPGVDPAKAEAQLG